MNLQEAISIVLKNNRTLCGLSQEELASRCDLHRTYLSLLERGLRKPTLNVIFDLCSNLKIKPSEFVTQIQELIDSDC